MNRIHTQWLCWINLVVWTWIGHYRTALPPTDLLASFKSGVGLFTFSNTLYGTGLWYHGCRKTERITEGPYMKAEVDVVEFSSWLAGLLHLSVLFILLSMWLSFVFFSPSLFFSISPLCVWVRVCVCIVGFDLNVCLSLPWLDRDLEQPTETSDSLLVEGSGDLE